MKGLPDLHHLTNQGIVELAGVVVLVLIGILVATTLGRRLRRRSRAPLMEDQPIDLSQRLGKLIEGITPEPAPSAEPPAGTPVLPQENVGVAGTPERVIPAPQTSILAGGVATGMLGDGTGMLGDATYSASLSSWSGASPPASTVPSGQPLFASSAERRLQETTGVVPGTVLSLPGAQVFDYRALKSLWHPIYAEETPQTAPLQPLPVSTSWVTAILPNRESTADGWDAPEAFLSDMSARGATSDELSTRNLNPTTEGQALGDTGWDTGPLHAPAASGSWDEPLNPSEQPASNWSSSDAWSVSEAPATAADPWSSGTGSLDVLPSNHNAVSESREAVPDENDSQESSWTQRLAGIGITNHTSPASAYPTGQLGTRQPAEAGEDDKDAGAPGPAADWDSPLSDLERLSSFPVTDMPPADRALTRTRGAPPEPDQEQGGDGWESVSLPPDPVLAATSQPAPLPHQPTVSVPPIETVQPPMAAPVAQSLVQKEPLQSSTPVSQPASPAPTPTPYDITLTPDDLASLQTQLAAVASLPDGRRATLVRRDGSPLVGSLQDVRDLQPPTGADSHAVLAATLAASSRCSTFAGLGPFDTLTVVGRDGMLLVMETGPLTLLAVLVDKEARLGPLRRSLRRHVESIRDYLSSRYVS